MKALRLLGRLACCLTVCAGLAGADSIQLRNGRHLQGKYIGGTATTIGFMTGRTVEYFATFDVLVLIFENSNDSPESGLKPNPLKKQSLPQASGIAPERRIDASTRNHVQRPKQQVKTHLNSHVHSDAKLGGKTRGLSRIRTDGDWDGIGLHLRGMVRRSLFLLLRNDLPLRECLLDSYRMGCTTCTMLLRTA